MLKKSNIVVWLIIFLFFFPSGLESGNASSDILIWNECIKKGTRLGWRITELNFIDEDLFRFGNETLTLNDTFSIEFFKNPEVDPEIVFTSNLLELVDFYVDGEKLDPHQNYVYTSILALILPNAVLLENGTILDSIALMYKISQVKFCEIRENYIISQAVGVVGDSITLKHHRISGINSEVFQEIPGVGNFKWNFEQKISSVDITGKPNVETTAEQNQSNLITSFEIEIMIFSLLIMFVFKKCKKAGNNL